MRAIVVGLTLGGLPLETAVVDAADAPSPAPAASPAADAPLDPCATIAAVVTRPSVTTSVCPVPRGRVLIETGYQNTLADGGGALAQYPQALIRVGTTIPKLEISVAPPSLERAAGANGTSDSALGAKYELGSTSRLLYGVNAFATLPTGQNGYSAGGTGYSANLNLSYELTPALSAASTLGYNSLATGAQRFTSFIPSLVLSLAAGPTTSVYGEAASFSHALGPASATRVQFLGGISQSFANRVQIDVEAARSGTTSTGKYRYFGVGLSYWL